MKKLVILPGGFHPYHAGHKALYDAAVAAFPRADVFVAATADTSSRPFPFSVKRFLAQQAGVPANRFIQVKSPFRAEEITQMYDPDDTQLIFVRSDKDRMKPPQAGGVKRDGSPAYLQPYRRNGLGPMRQHGYITYLPTVQFGPGMTSATEIRAKWPDMSEEEKISLVQSMYPNTVNNDAAAGKIVAMLDEIMPAAVPEAMAGSQAGLLGAPVGGGAAGLNPSGVDQPNGVPRQPKANRAGFREARLINDPDQGTLIAPTDTQQQLPEQELMRDVARQLGEVVRSLRSGQYRNVEHLLYSAGGLENRVRALARYQDYQDKTQGRTLAAGATVDIGESDYIEEKLSKLMPNH
jgi:hypothetical protein